MPKVWYTDNKGSKVPLWSLAQGYISSFITKDETGVDNKTRHPGCHENRTEQKEPDTQAN